MRMILQRVQEASVSVERQQISATNQGWLILLGISESDDESLIEPMCKKVVHLRAFNDDQNKMNCSLLDLGGEILLVSQFTLYGDCRKGRRPSFTKAAPPDKADSLYQLVAKTFRSVWNVPVQTGEFGAHMEVRLLNDGPVTFIIDSADLGIRSS